MTAALFPFRFHPLFRAAALPFGVRDETAFVAVDDEHLRVHFGPWKVRTPLSNVVSARVTGPYVWPKVIGPPHLSFADRGLTLATNADVGTCIRFERPVRGIDPLGLVAHPAVTVTVLDAAALAELLYGDHHDEQRIHADAERPTLDDLLEATHDDLRSLSAAELRRRAAARGVTGVARRSKAELVDLLEPDAQVIPGSGEGGSGSR